jgi:hypothetical protein
MKAKEWANKWLEKNYWECLHPVKDMDGEWVEINIDEIEDEEVVEVVEEPWGEVIEVYLYIKD